MPSITGYVDNTGSEGYAHWQMLLLIHHFAGGYGTLAAPAFVGTGTGTLTKLDTHPATVTETWTIQCTSAPSAGNEAWSVTGSVSGAKAAATTGVAYDNGLLAFTVAAGATAFAVGDKFTVGATQGALSAINRAWTVLHYLNPNDITQTRELILQGSGISGTEQIFVGFRTYQSVSADYYNMTASVFTGYVAGAAWNLQPGVADFALCAHNQTIKYWLAVNGQRVLLGMKVGTPVYEMAYAGKFLPYATPGQYPYPVAVAGTLGPGMPATRYSDTSNGHTFGVRGQWTSASDPNNSPNGALRDLNGNWDGFRTYPWTFLSQQAAPPFRDTGGNYQAIGATLMTGAAAFPNVTGNVWGEFDGVRFISGFNNMTENTLTIGGVEHVVLQDVFRTGTGDMFLLEMS